MSERQFSELRAMLVRAEPAAALVGLIDDLALLRRDTAELARRVRDLEARG